MSEDEELDEEVPYSNNLSSLKVAPLPMTEQHSYSSSHFYSSSKIVQLMESTPLDSRFRVTNSHRKLY
jgi:hypothetical protein